MSLSLLDGPCEGTYLCKRAPLFLRAIVDEKGEKDCLDLVDDTPAESEKVYVYKREGAASVVHLYFGGNKGGWYALGQYRFMPDVDGEALRDNEAWQKWAKKQ